MESKRPAYLDQFTQVSTATIASQLLKRGIRACAMDGPRPLSPGVMVGHAFTLRYVPSREDRGISTYYDNETNPQRIAVESIGADDVLVIDSRGDTSAGGMGNILATRIRARGGAGMVTDGAVRDAEGCAATGLQVFAGGSNPRLSSCIHEPVDMQLPIACGGVQVIPGDVIVGDCDGVVVVPRDLAQEVADDALAQEVLEKKILAMIQDGASLAGVYPPSDETLAQIDGHV